MRDGGYNFEVCVPDVEEISGDDPFSTVVYNAALKAEKASESCEEGAIVIAADTLVSCDGRVLGKPKSFAEAKQMLKFLSGREQMVMTAVCIVCGDSKIEFTEESSLFFKKLSDDQIDEYHSLVDPLDKAGAYNIDEFGDMLVDRLEGSYENVMGLPIDALKSYLSQMNVSVN